MGQYKYFLKIQEDKVKDERKERELLLEDFKELGLKNKRLEDDLKAMVAGLASESSLWKIVKKSFRGPKRRRKNSES